MSGRVVNFQKCKTSGIKVTQSDEVLRLADETNVGRGQNRNERRAEIPSQSRFVQGQETKR